MTEWRFFHSLSTKKKFCIQEEHELSLYANANTTTKIASLFVCIDTDIEGDTKSKV